MSEGRGYWHSKLVIGGVSNVNTPVSRTTIMGAYARILPCSREVVLIITYHYIFNKLIYMQINTLQKRFYFLRHRNWSRSCLS